MRRLVFRSGTMSTPRVERPRKRLRQRRLGFEPLEDRRLLDGGGMPGILFVDGDAPGIQDGSSWADAFSTLQDALAVAAQGDEIRVAQGTYTPAEAGGDRYASFRLVAGLTVSGGYAGARAADPDARDIALYPTILSGDLNGDDGPGFLNNDENSYHVVTGGGENAVLDGLTISGGNANDVWPNAESFGGGLYEYSGTVSNCIIRANAADEGGGLYGSSGQFIQCVIADNMALRRGGGASLDTESPTFTYCVFRGNTADTNGSDGRGGGIFTLDNSPDLINCVFTGNLARVGGALYVMENYDSLMVNCVFAGNRALETGGGLYNDGSGSPGAPVLSNCIFWANATDGGTDESAQIAGVAPTINYSCVQGLTGDLGGVGNIGRDPLFVDADGPDNHFGTADDDLHLLPVSPCINAGDNLAVPPALTTDLDGNPRIFDGHVDIGAYESSSLVTNIAGTDGSDDFTLSRTLDHASLQIISPGGAYTYPIEAITALRFTGGTGGDRLTVDFTNGTPVPAGGIAFAAGAADDPGDCLIVQGTASGDSVVMNGNQVTVNGWLIHPNGVEFFGFDLGEQPGGSLAGVSGLYKAGPGTLVLAGTNSYSGDTTVDGGKLVVTGANALPSDTSLVISGGSVVLDTGLNEAVKVSGLRLNLGTRSAAPSTTTSNVSTSKRTTASTEQSAAAIVPVAMETSMVPPIPQDTPATEVETQSRLSLCESIATLAERKGTLACMTNLGRHKQPAKPRWFAVNTIAAPAKTAVATKASAPHSLLSQRGKAHDAALQAVVSAHVAADLNWRRVVSRVQSRVYASQQTIDSILAKDWEE